VSTGLQTFENDSVPVAAFNAWYGSDQHSGRAGFSNPAAGLGRQIGISVQIQKVSGRRSRQSTLLWESV
jgi:hypothetical protein